MQLKKSPKNVVSAWGRVVGLVVTALVLRTGIVSAKKIFWA
jgi:hypothetical protein